jgi:hypothetical protein
MINSVCDALAVGAAVMITAEHPTLGPGGRSGVQEGCLDVADQAQDQRPWIWPNAMSVAGFLDDGDLANQHPNSVLD